MLAKIIGWLLSIFAKKMETPVVELEEDEPAEVEKPKEPVAEEKKPLKVIDDLLDVDEYARPGKVRKETRMIVLHWTAAPNQKAKDTIQYWRTGKTRKAYGSANYVIEVGGDVYRAVPSKEVTYHCGSSQVDPASRKVYTDWAREKLGAYASTSNSPNNCTIGIELEPTDADGNFAQATLAAAAELTATLLKNYELASKNVDDVVGTHNKIVGWKNCPKLWTDHPEKFEEFKGEVRKLLA
jgi:N-acetylmuramoyl-L-alanine amidase